MKITTMVATLMSSFTKDVIEQELEDLQKQINTINLPFFEAAGKDFARYKFRNKLVEDLEDSMFSGVKIKKANNFLMAFLYITKTMQSQMPAVERLVDNNFEFDVSASSLNLIRVNILNYIPIMTFVSRYMRAFTNVAISLEINGISESSVPTYDIIPADRDWLSANRQAFLDSIAIITKRAGDIEKTFNDLPDMNVDQSNAKVIEMTQGGKADPLGMGFIPLSINPIFHFRKLVMNYQVERYHLAKAEHDMLQRKLYNLRQLNQGKQDAKMQQEIQYIEVERVRPLSQKIQQMEQDYVHNA